MILWAAVAVVGVVVAWGIYGWRLGQVWIGRDPETGWPYLGIWIL